MDHLLEKYLENLKNQVSQMGGLVEESMRLSVKALTSKNGHLFEDVMKNEDRVNAFHKDLDHAVFKLVARQSPVAGDLRMLLSISKINVDLERMGDLAKSIALCVKDYLECSPMALATEFPKMADLVRSMVNQSIDCFVSGSADLAYEVLRLDDAVDRYRDSVCLSLREHMKANPADVDAASYLMIMIRNLERIGDHATNIAEDVVFSLTGEDIKHSSVEDHKGGTDESIVEG